MKITMFVDSDSMQFNLTPENDHEKEFSEILKKYNGSVSIHNGIDIGMCKGDYMRNFGDQSNSIGITIRKLEEKINDRN
jgi:hypothetical protein